MYFGRQNVTSRVKYPIEGQIELTFRDDSSCSADGSVQGTGKTWTALCTALSELSWLVVLPVTVHWLRLVPLGKNPHSDSACSRTCPQSLGGYKNLKNLEREDVSS